MKNPNNTMPQCDLSVVSSSLRGLANQLTIEADSIEAACAAQKEVDGIMAEGSSKYGPILTVPEAAELVKIDVQTMRKWTHIDGFPALKVGNSVRISFSLFMEWFNNNVGKTVVI